MRIDINESNNWRGRKKKVAVQTREGKKKRNMNKKQ
jgi:hypothetical protein